MNQIEHRLSAAAALVLEAMPNHLAYSGVSAIALSDALKQLAAEVEALLAAIWGLGANPN